MFFPRMYLGDWMFVPIWMNSHGAREFLSCHVNSKIAYQNGPLRNVKADRSLWNRKVGSGLDFETSRSMFHLRDCGSFGSKFAVHSRPWTPNKPRMRSIGSTRLINLYPFSLARFEQACPQTLGQFCRNAPYKRREISFTLEYIECHRCNKVLGLIEVRPHHH